MTKTKQVRNPAHSAAWHAYKTYAIRFLSLTKREMETLQAWGLRARADGGGWRNEDRAMLATLSASLDDYEPARVAVSDSQETPTEGREE